MWVASLSFWLLCWLAMELLTARYAATQLSITLLFVLNQVCLLMALELDLLGTFILATYSSVFVALFLLALHFGPFWMPSGFVGERQTGAGFGLWGGCLAASFASSLLFQPEALTGAWEGNWVLSILWQDLQGSAQSGLWSIGAVLHWLFFKLMVLETVALNLYLLLGLVGAVSILTLRQLWVDSTSTLLSENGARRLGGLGWRIRVAARFRRQTRRTNTSQLRQR